MAGHGARQQKARPMMRMAPLLAATLLLLSGCSDVSMDTLPSWLGGATRLIKRAPGERIDVLLNQSKLMPDVAVAGVPIEVPEATNLNAWPSHNAAMQTPHLTLGSITNAQHIKIGNGNAFSRTSGPTPVVSSGLIIAMDAAGVVSAHETANIESVRWKNADGLRDEVSDAVGGGLTIAAETLYATTGTGGVRALTLTRGTLKWNVNVGAPIRGAPAAGNGIVVVITADNQTIALDAETGATRWTHRGIKEAASYVSAVAPTIYDGMVVSAYSSGEIFVLRAESGNVVWSDALGGSIRTRASAVFSGIDADPIVAEGVVVAISAAGEIQASQLSNGRPLWQKKIGGHHTPWSAGNVLYVLSDTHDVAAIFKKDGSIRWATSLAVTDQRDSTRDVTPPLYGPVLAGNTVLVLSSQGVLYTFNPQDGVRVAQYDVATGSITAPLIIDGALYLVTKDARLYRYY